MNNFLDETTAFVAKMVADAADKAFKSGFYAGQANAGVTLNQCHENWKKLNEEVVDEKSV